MELSRISRPRFPIYSGLMQKAAFRSASFVQSSATPWSCLRTRISLTPSRLAPANLPPFALICAGGAGALYFVIRANLAQLSRLGFLEAVAQPQVIPEFEQ
jgi:hypothetical protein